MHRDIKKENCAVLLVSRRYYRLLNSTRYKCMAVYLKVLASAWSFLENLKPVHCSLLIFSDSIQVHSRGDNALTLTVAKNLGSLFDEQLTMSTHINKLCGVAFYHLHDIKRIRKYLSRESTILLITFKAIHGLAPKYLRNLLTFKSSLYNLRSSGSILLTYAICSIEDVRW